MESKRKIVPFPNRRRRGWFCFAPQDLTFLCLVVVLSGVGLLMLFSASYPYAYYVKGDALFYVVRQGMHLLLGVAAMLAVSCCNYRLLKRYGRVLLWGSIVLLVLVLVPGVGVVRNNAQRWISVFGLFTFQPSEIVKLGVIVGFSASITRNRSRMHTLRYGILPYGGILVLIFVLMMRQPHLSGSILICGTGAALMFVGGIAWRWVALGMGAAATGMALLISGVVTYGQSRIAMWQDPFVDAMGEGFQLSQSLIAIGSGGLLGKGFGQSRQKYLFLPEVQNDFIFAIVCEELGFIGAVLLIVVFCCLILRGYWIALCAKDRFGCLITVGVTTKFALQTFLNLAVVSGFVPTTGISLPFFSYGGTALLFQMIEMGLVLSVSRQMY